MIAWITVPYWWHATVLEISWLGGGVVATILTALNLHDSWKDHRLLSDIQADPEVHEPQFLMIEISARGRAASQASRLAISLLIMVTGVIGVIQPNPLHGLTTWTGLTVTGCLVAISLLTALRSFFDHRQRNLLYELALRRAPLEIDEALVRIGALEAKLGLASGEMIPGPAIVTETSGQDE